MKEEKCSEQLYSLTQTNKQKNTTDYNLYAKHKI